MICIQYKNIYFKCEIGIYKTFSEMTNTAEMAQEIHTKKNPKTKSNK